MAAVLAVPASAVAVTGVTDAPSRRLLAAAGGVAVAFSVTTASRSAATGLTASIAAVSASPSGLVAALQSSGLSGCTGVAVAAATVEEPSVPAVNVSAIANISSAVAAVTTQLSTASAADAAVLQGAILSSLSASSVNVTLTAVEADLTASLVLAVVDATAQLDTSTQNAALDVLASVASVSVSNTTNNATAQTITSALSAIATSAAVSNPAALSVVQDVVDTMTGSQARTLVAQLAAQAPGAAELPPLVTQSAMISTSVQVDAPGSSRLSSTSLTFPNSSSAFEPLPAALLADVTTSIVTQFMTLAFDPYAAANSTTGRSSNFTTSGGITRLALSSPDGTAIVVANASTPILFTLPAVNVSASGEQSACAFWDVVANAYSGVGCVALPNPRPPNSSVFFTPGFSSTSDADIVRAWDINGTLAANCNYLLMDCADPAPGPVYPDPRSPLSAPAVTCPARSNVTNASSAPPPVLRVYYGAACALWRPDNAASCHWDNALQTFRGAGCVFSAAPTSCACRHLTDFAACRVPTIQTCSLSDMTSLAPGDIVTKLRFLFIVVVSLFGFMNVGAIFAFYEDVKERRATLAALQSPAAGFRELPCGTWVWACEQTPLDGLVAAPHGSAFELAAVFGLPFVRLRAALPEELLPGAVGQAVGRVKGLSLAGLEEARDETIAVMAQLGRALLCCAPAEVPGKAARTAQIPRLVLDLDLVEDIGEPEREHTLALPPTSHTMSSRMQRLADQLRASGVGVQNAPENADVDGVSHLLTGTALVLAFMENAKTIPLVQLAFRVEAAHKYFGDARVPGVDLDFEALRSQFVLLLSEGNLSGREDWLEKARLWRFVLLQRSDGGFDLTESLAFALQAREGAVPPRMKKPSKWFAVLAALVGGGGDDESDEEEELDDALRDADDGGDDGDAAEEQEGDAGAFAADCPLTFSANAIAQRLPLALCKLNKKWEAEQAERAKQTAWEHKISVAAAAHQHSVALAVAAAQRRLDSLVEDVRAELIPLAPEWLMLVRVSHNPEAVASMTRFNDNAASAATTDPAGAVLGVIANVTTGLLAAACSLQSRAAELPAPMHLRRERLLSMKDTCQRHLARLHTLAGSLSKAAAHVQAVADEVMPPMLDLPRCDLAPAPTADKMSATARLSSCSEALSTLSDSGRSRVPVERIWCTLLAVSALANSEVCMLTDEPEEGVHFRTLVDAGYAFLDEQAAADRRVRKLLASGVLQELAAKSLHAWGRIQAANVEALRETDVITRYTALNHLQRGSARVVRSLMIDHGTFATFLDTSGYMMRWQRFMIIVTLVLSTLLTSIWFYSSRGAQCCAELRMLLDAGAGGSLLDDGTCAPPDAPPDAGGGCPPGLGPCLGYEGDCAALPDQFIDLQGCYVYGDPGAEEAHDTLVDYVCHAFPDDAYVTDQFFVALISVAVALPVDIFLNRMFEIANEGELPETWLEAPPAKWRKVLGDDCHNGWRLADPAAPVRDVVLWLVHERNEGFIATALRLVNWLWSHFRSHPKPEELAAEYEPNGVDEQASETSTSSNDSAAAGDALAKRLYASAGLLGIYVVWAIFSWFIFVYGSLIYKQLGPAAEQEFAKTWGVGFALDNASEWQDVLKTAVQAALVVVVLDALRLSRSGSWFEQHVDFMSLQCNLYASGARNWWQQTHTLVKLQARLVD